MDPNDSVRVCSRNALKLLQIGPDELRPAFAEDPEDLRRFHPYLVICIGDQEIQYYCFPPKGTPVAKARLATEELYKLQKKK